MASSDLGGQIERHCAAIAGLAARVHVIQAAVDTLTREGREMLADYQSAKRHAAEVLATVGDRYAAAQQHLGQIDGLFADLAKAREDHVGLTHAVNKLLATGHAGGPQLCDRLADARRDLRAVCAAIEQAHADAGHDDADDEPL